MISQNMNDKERFEYMLFEWSMDWWYTLSQEERDVFKEKYNVRYDNNDGVKYIYKRENNY